MSRPFNILFVSSEVDPFAKTGGLADVAGALPKALAWLGNEVRVALPLYKGIDEPKFNIHELQQIKSIPIQIGQTSELASVKTTQLDSPKSTVQVYFIRNDKFFRRDGLYTDTQTKQDYPDNDERFIFFSRAVLELLKALNWQVDIIHCNDWQSGLSVAYLKKIYSDSPFFQKTKAVFTIHNLAYQGRFPKDSFEKTGLPWSIFNPDGIEFYGDVNFLKAGMVYADAVTTVSRKYAEEIASSPEYGYGLEGLLRARQDALHGIVNGIDYSVWNPEIDPLIPQNYTIRTIAKKKLNKSALRQKFGLAESPKTPVLGMISRLADQKGFDLLEAIAWQLMSHDVQLVVLGTGEPKYHTMLEQLRQQFPEKVGVFLGFNNQLAHWIEAGSDMFLMPSRYEPCGLNQMYSLKYGTVPIVRATGGLDDTIEDFDPATKKGTGFKFSNYDSQEFFKAILRALETYRKPALWKAVMTNGMKKDFSWEASAKQYVDLYRTLLQQ